MQIDADSGTTGALRFPLGDTGRATLLKVVEVIAAAGLKLDYSRKPRMGWIACTTQSHSVGSLGPCLIQKAMHVINVSQILLEQRVSKARCTFVHKILLPKMLLELD